MPASLTDYCQAGGVELTDSLSPEQVASLLEDASSPASKQLEAVRAKAMRQLPAHERVRMSGLALLHAYAATHGRGCALAALRKGPMPTQVRDHAMLRIYRGLTGDTDSSDQRLVTKSLELYRRRVSCRGSGVLSGADRPSLGMRRSFAGMQLIERSVQSFHVGGAERLTMEHKEGRTLLTKSRDMDVKGLVIGSLLLVQGPDPDSGAQKWYRAKVRGLVFRCGLPPVLITYVATEAGDTNSALLPSPADSACFKHETRSLNADTEPKLQLL